MDAIKQRMEYRDLYRSHLIAVDNKDLEADVDFKAIQLLNTIGYQLDFIDTTLVAITAGADTVASGVSRAYMRAFAYGEAMKALEADVRALTAMCEKRNRNQIHLEDIAGMIREALLRREDG